VPGITPRAVNLLFDIIHDNEATFRTKVKVYMVELYLDTLVDLLYKVDKGKRAAAGPKLDIKKNKKVGAFAGVLWSARASFGVLASFRAWSTSRTAWRKT